MRRGPLERTDEGGTTMAFGDLPKKPNILLIITTKNER
jgi:hypothetical protein